MSLFSPLLEARVILGLEQHSDRAALRSAYRRQVALHPPDRDPEAFRRVRDAYETLKAPVEPLRRRLRRAEPLVAPPRAPGTPERVSCRGATLVALVREVVAGLDVERCLNEIAEARATRAPARTPRGSRKDPQAARGPTTEVADARSGWDGDRGAGES